MYTENTIRTEHGKILKIKDIDIGGRILTVELANFGQKLIIELGGTKAIEIKRNGYKFEIISSEIDTY